MPSSPHRHHRPRRHLVRLVALTASVLAVAAVGASTLLVTGAQGDSSRTHVQQERIEDRAAARRAIAKAARTTPLARESRCGTTRAVHGQGRSCRTRDGMYLVEQRDGQPLMTHGPDVLAAAPRAGHGGGFGTTRSIVCSPASRSRHVALVYLLPKDFATAPAGHGDRYAEVAEQMRQALLDAATVVDRRAGELAGQRRRMRVLCDPDGRPSVERVVLPHTAAEYRDFRAGFGMIGDDLKALGQLPSYDRYASVRVTSVRRVLGYYDADFLDGYAGQGTMFRRSTLMKQGRVKASDPLISKSTRNINNNPPNASLAVQYGTRDGAGVPDPPLYTSLLHELSHTMGAVQDEPPTSSDTGHCVDGLDLMCYFDNVDSRYTDSACPDPASPVEPQDELFDCNGDTYFHPRPPAGNPLASPVTWQLGLVANETLSPQTVAPPGGVSGLRVLGRGTRLVLRWSAADRAVGYEVSWRRASGGAWEHVFTTRQAALPILRPRTSYELRVAAVGRGLVTGTPAVTHRRTGIDNSPPARPGPPRAAYVSRTSARLRFVHARDNVRVTRYLVERRVGTRWRGHQLLSAPVPRVAVPGDLVTSPLIGGLRSGSTYVLRLRALDARGNRSLPSRAVRVTTRR